jgi:hypothetical protein
VPSAHDGRARPSRTSTLPPISPRGASPYEIVSRGAAGPSASARAETAARPHIDPARAARAAAGTAIDPLDAAASARASPITRRSPPTGAATTPAAIAQRRDEAERRLRVERAQNRSYQNER